MEQVIVANWPEDIAVVTNITGTSGMVTGLVPGQPHTWYVSGVDAAGNASPLMFAYIVATNPVPVAPRLTALAPTTPGGFQITASEGGSVLQTVLIQATTDLADPNSWVQIGSVLPSANPFNFTDTNAAQYPKRFYRIVAP
jgi:hypothetical protein